MRSVKLWSAVTALAFGLGFGSSAQAAFDVFLPGDSTLSISIGTSIGALAPITVAGTGGTASFDGTTLTDSANIWVTTGSVGTALFTAVPLISNLFFTIANGPGLINTTLVAPVAGPNLAVSGVLQGTEGLVGEVAIHGLDGLVMIPFPLDGVAGVGGRFSYLVVGQPLTVSGAGFGTQATVLNVTTITPSGGMNLAGSVTAMGGISTTANGKRIVTVVSPLRIDTGPLFGSLGGFVTKRFAFVPEPGTLLLLGTGLAGLASVSRRR